MNDSPIVHPGLYVRNHVIPKGMSVTKAAETLGVGRPALSNFLNGKAALSPQMAAKLERAFPADADDLMQRQAAYDSARRPDGAAVSATTRTFVPPFLMTKASDLEDWANTAEARDLLAVLLRTLINSTCGGLKLVDFPGYDDAQRPGWDGQVETTEGNPWVPEGVSKWEFGTDRNINRKANGDYQKRTQNTDEAERQRTAFVFVTPRRWHGKANWLHDRTAEKQWRTVRALDASDLEQWLEQSIPAQAWFGNLRGISMDGVKSLDRCWIEWCADCEPRFVEDVFAEAISAFGEKILNHLRNRSGKTLRIVADSRQEGLAFLSAFFAQTKEGLQGYRDQAVVFTEQGPLSKLAVGSPAFLPIMTSSSVERELAQSGCKLTGFTVETRTTMSQESCITLEPLSDRAFTEGLEKMGRDRERIQRLERASGRSLTVLRRQLAQSEAIRSPEWSSDQNLASSLVPLMLAGAWVANKDADQYLMTELAGVNDYDQLEKNFNRLLDLEDSPVWSVGGFRGVVSKSDALFGIHQWMTPAQIDRFIEIAELVLSERNPALDLAEDQRWAAQMYGKAREISSPLRKGIAESLVLLSVHGDSLMANRLPTNLEHRAARLIDKLLDPMTPDRLKSQSSNFPLYAEAAPEAFLAIFEGDLALANPVVASLMQPIDNTSFQRNYRTGLLWALELLAWQPEWLDRVVVLLAKLAEIEPKDNWVNKPSASLYGIFRAWMPQTAAPIDQRIAVFDRLTQKHPQVAWQIATASFALGQQVAMPSSRPKWRDYALGFGNGATVIEWQTFTNHCMHTCLSWRIHTRETLAHLVRTAEAFSPSQLTQLEDKVVKWADQVQDQDRAWLREKVRESLGWAMRRKAKDKLTDDKADQCIQMTRKLYDLLEPSDVVLKHAWLFESSWIPEFWDDPERDSDYNVRTERTQTLRTKAMREVMVGSGYRGMLDLALSGNAAHSGGWSAAKALESESEHVAFIHAALNDGDILNSAPHQALMSGFLNGMGVEAALRVVERHWSKFSAEVGVKLLCLCQFGQLVWSKTREMGGKLDDTYWVTVQPFWGEFTDDDSNYAVSRLLTAGRPRAAFSLANLDWKRVESSHIISILTDLPKSEEASHSQYPLDSYRIQEALEILNERQALSQTEMAKLELLYIDLLWLEEGSTPNLEKEIEDNPDLFCELLAFAYPSENDSGRRELSEGQRIAAQKAYKLLDKLAHTPGFDKSEHLNSHKLTNWISKVQYLSNADGRRSKCDYHIGQILSKAPSGEDGAWPSTQIREVLEQVLNENIEQGFLIGRQNSRGMQERSEDGAQERELAAQYGEWARACDYSTPKVANALRRLASIYESEAQWWDRDAAVQRRLGY